MWNFRLISAATSSDLTKTSLQMYFWGLTGLFTGTTLFRILQYFGIMDLKACSPLNEMQLSVLENQVRLDVDTSQTIEHFLSVLSFENNYMSNDFSSEELDYFFRVAKNQGLSHSQGNEKLAKLQIQMRDLYRLSKSINNLGIFELFSEFTRISSDFNVLREKVDQELNFISTANNPTKKIKFNIFNIQIELSKVAPKPSTQAARKWIAKLDSMTNKLAWIEEEIKKKEPYFLDSLISFFGLLTDCVEEFWDFFTLKHHSYFKDWAYEVYESRVKNYQLKPKRVDEIDVLDFNAYRTFLAFVEVVTDLAGIEDPDALTLSRAEQKAASRLKYADDESMWIDMPVTRSSPITAEEVRQRMKESGQT